MTSTWSSCWSIGDTALSVRILPVVCAVEPNAAVTRAKSLPSWNTASDATTPTKPSAVPPTSARPAKMSSRPALNFAPNSIAALRRKLNSRTEKYLELSAKLKEFVKQLLEQCSTTEEVELILKQRHMGAPCNAIFPRIYLALQCRQREFIAHENCQQVLQAAWLDEWQDWRGMSVLSKLLRLLMRLILFPFLALVYILMPRPIQWLERYMRPPIHRYLLSTSSYLAFLILVFIVISHDREAKYRGPPQSGLEWGIIVYVLGYSWDAFKRFQLQRAHTFFASWWNIYDLLDLLLFYCTFGIWYELWQRQATVPPKDRMEWEWDDPVLVAESLFAFATILAFGKLLQIFRVDRRMGPLLISLGKMVFDMIRFLVVYVCVVLSFSTGLSNMYETYHDQVISPSVALAICCTMLQ
ncbi:hypothetical protein RvY_14040-2 [Ramazzottius varieornatus]|uniref:Ion transport domain-containing protein n=1 Tax=Ramazzottius varieornatus TaxID=947166 RepID=A0A1D1VS13_RAMVA|nr:hypothetical protein RvY_14040-2 [Ramazzottius varieornatus]